jgi:hypothetical protein
MFLRTIEYSRGCGRTQQSLKAVEYQRKPEVESGFLIEGSCGQFCGAARAGTDPD